MKDKIYRAFESAIDGGSTETFYSVLDRLCDESPKIEQYVRDNEMEIARMFDDHWFTCTTCGWTYPVDHMGEKTDGGELQCEGCDIE